MVSFWWTLEECNCDRGEPGCSGVASRPHAKHPAAHTQHPAMHRAHPTNVRSKFQKWEDGVPTDSQYIVKPKEPVQ